MLAVIWYDMASVSTEKIIIQNIAGFLKEGAHFADLEATFSMRATEYKNNGKFLLSFLLVSPSLAASSSSIILHWAVQIASGKLQKVERLTLFSKIILGC